MASYKIAVYSGSALPEQYRALIFSKWLRSLRYGNDYFKLIDQDTYFAVYHAYLEQLLTRPDSTVRLAVLTDDPDVVLGWAVSEGNRLHYVYVNRENRRVGIARKLSGRFDVITHLTKMGMSIWASHFNSDRSKQSAKPLVVFNPF